MVSLTLDVLLDMAYSTHVMYVFATKSFGVPLQRLCSHIGNMNERAEYDAEEVGARIKIIRTAHAISQGTLAKICGVVPSAVGNWEQGRARPTLAQAKAIADEFDLTLDYIFLGRSYTLKHGINNVLEAATAKNHTEYRKL